MRGKRTRGREDVGKSGREGERTRGRGRREREGGEGGWIEGEREEGEGGGRREGGLQQGRDDVRKVLAVVGRDPRVLAPDNLRLAAL